MPPLPDFLFFMGLCASFHQYPLALTHSFSSFYAAYVDLHVYLLQILFSLNRCLQLSLSAFA
jgi:hypothetical protein